MSQREKDEEVLHARTRPGQRLIILWRVPRRSTGAAVCVTCLQASTWEKEITAGHVFNRQDRRTWPPPEAQWTSKDGRLVILRTAAMVSAPGKEKEQLVLGGRSSDLQGLTVPICKTCQKLEAQLDEVAQRRCIVKPKGSGDQVTVVGFEPGSHIQAGTVLSIEDRRPMAEEGVAIKVMYFLTVAAMMHSTSSLPQTVEWWQELLSQSGERLKVLRAMDMEWRSRVTLTEDGQDMFPGRILFVK